MITIEIQNKSLAARWKNKDTVPFLNKGIKIITDLIGKRLLENTAKAWPQEVTRIQIDILELINGESIA